MKQEPATKPLPEGWTFALQDVSAGVYRVTGVGPGGTSAERTGTDEKTIFLAVVADAEELSRRL